MKHSQGTGVLEIMGFSTERKPGDLLRTLVLLGLDCWCYLRWVLLKLLSKLIGLGHRALGVPKQDERCVIRLGNVLFPSGWPETLFDSYEHYDRQYRPDIRPYLSLAPAEQWLVGKDVLDLGSGLGGYSRELVRCGARHVTSLEVQLDKAAYAHAWRTEGMVVVNASALQLPFRDQSFDSVFSHTVFEHLPDVRRALEEIRRVLRPGGRALIGFNFFHHRGGHHLFPYIHFPWPTWVVSEQAACAYWSECLRRDQALGRMRFYPPGSAISTLAEGNEISLNRMRYAEFEQMLQQVGLKMEKRIPSETVARLFPWLIERLPVRDFLMGSVFYCLSNRANQLARSCAQLAGATGE